MSASVGEGLHLIATFTWEMVQYLTGPFIQQHLTGSWSVSDTQVTTPEFVVKFKELAAN